MKKKTTIKELAKILGVSVSTISKALHDSPEIGETTKRKVKELAELYDYVPNPVAVSLKNQSTRMIGVVIPNIQNPFFSDVLKNIEMYARQENYRIITFFTNEKLQDEKESLLLLSNGMVDGILVCPSEETFSKNTFDHFLDVAEATPLVTFDRIHKQLDYNSVSVDDAESIVNACMYLKDSGMKNICFVSSIGALSIGKTRLNSFVHYISENAGIKGQVIEDNNLDTLKEKLENVLNDKNTMPDAILGADIESTLIANAIILKKKLEYKKEISLLGYVNPGHNELQYPSISHIHQYPEKIGKQAVDRLLQMIKNPNAAMVQEVIITSIEKKDTSL